MIIKKYQGKSEAEALVLAQKELGDGVVLMNTKRVKPKGFMRLFKTSYVEITVAKEEEHSVTVKTEQVSNSIPEHEKPAEKTSPVVDSSAKEIEERLNSLESLLEKRMNLDEVVPSPVKTESVTSSESEKEEVKSEKEATFDMIKKILIENEVDESYVSPMMDEIFKSLKEDSPMEQILSGVYQRMILRFGKAEKIEPAKSGVKTVFFVGTTGVGKTTTIAKIASKFIVEEKKKVALLTTDTYRIAAAEQLRTYANILEIPFRVIYTASEILDAIEAFSDFDYILVDTAGHSQYNENQRETMTEYVETVRDKVETEVFLVLAANTKYKDLLNVADSYKGVSDYKLIFTKLDETDTYGNLLNLKLHTGASMSYITCGQNVPDDIAPFDAQSIVKKLLGGR